MADMVNHPPHYKQYSFEVIDLTELFPFCLGNALKYILRAPFKGSFHEDVNKAIWYIERLENHHNGGSLERHAPSAAQTSWYLDSLNRSNIDVYAFAAILCLVNSPRHEKLLEIAKTLLKAWQFSMTLMPKKEAQKDIKEIAAMFKEAHHPKGVSYPDPDPIYKLADEVMKNPKLLDELKNYGAPKTWGI